MGQRRKTRHAGAKKTRRSAAPGASIGTLTVTGDVALNGVFRAEVSASPVASDLLQITGNVALGPTSVLDLSSFGNSFNTAATYTLISATGTRTGTFGSVLGTLPPPMLVVYGPHGVSLSPVPEPAHVLLLCGAGAGVAGWRRRKRMR